MDTTKASPIPRGPWSDLPPAVEVETAKARAPGGREPWFKPRRSAREPIIGNWKGLAVVIFLLLLAPPLARWASGVILGLIHGR